MAQKVERSALVMHSADECLKLVNDVSSYPQFLPWCAGAEVHREPSRRSWWRRWILKKAQCGNASLRAIGLRVPKRFP